VISPRLRPGRRIRTGLVVTRTPISDNNYQCRSPVCETDDSGGQMKTALMETTGAMSAATLKPTEQEHIFCPECGYFTPHSMRATDGSASAFCLCCLTLLVIAEATNMPRLNSNQ
jgi:hypothetical protein